MGRDGTWTGKNENKKSPRLPQHLQNTLQSDVFKTFFALQLISRKAYRESERNQSFPWKYYEIPLTPHHFP
jgi:hypothetical protein